MRKVWVVCGGPSTEHEVSLNSGLEVCRHIRTDTNSAHPVVITRDGRWIIGEPVTAGPDRDAALSAFFASARDGSAAARTLDLGEAVSLMLRQRVDCVFIAVHGQYGEDGCLQGLFETAGVPYTGSGILASALAFDKQLTLEAYRRDGLRTARSFLAGRGRPGATEDSTLAFPVFVKPVRGGSSVGISLARNAVELQAAVDAALALDDEALCEQRIAGVEVSCGVLDLVTGGTVETVALPPTEIRPVQSEYFDYTAKYVPGMSLEITPAQLPPKVIARIQDAAIRAHRVLGCAGMSRTDAIVPPGNDAEPVLLETNTIPGMTSTSLLPQQARAHGIEFPDLIEALIVHALHRSRAK
jgi:D-alanine-D-alanine ligase